MTLHRTPPRPRAQPQPPVPASSLSTLRTRLSQLTAEHQQQTAAHVLRSGTSYTGVAVAHQVAGAPTGYVYVTPIRSPAQSRLNTIVSPASSNVGSDRNNRSTASPVTAMSQTITQTQGATASALTTSIAGFGTSSSSQSSASPATAAGQDSSSSAAASDSNAGSAPAGSTDSSAAAQDLLTINRYWAGGYIRVMPLDGSAPFFLPTGIVPLLMADNQGFPSTLNATQVRIRAWLAANKWNANLGPRLLLLQEPNLQAAQAAGASAAQVAGTGSGMLASSATTQSVGAQLSSSAPATQSVAASAVQDGMSHMFATQPSHSSLTAQLGPTQSTLPLRTSSLVAAASTAAWPFPVPSTPQPAYVRLGVQPSPQLFAMQRPHLLATPHFAQTIPAGQPGGGGGPGDGSGGPGGPGMPGIVDGAGYFLPMQSQLKQPTPETFSGLPSEDLESWLEGITVVGETDYDLHREPGCAIGVRQSPRRRSHSLPSLHE